MTRPDYCPIAQEPCQAMCVLTGVRCQLQPVKPASTEDLKVYQSIADNYKKGTTMDRHDQMREALQQVRRDIESLTALQNGTVNHIVKNACGTLDRVLQALAAERLPLVRLTEQEAKAAYQRGIDESENRGIQSAAHWLGLKTVMDAMERVNGGQQ